MARLIMAMCIAYALAPGCAMAADKFLCAADRAIGFSDEKQAEDFQPSEFTDNSKYILRRDEADPRKLTLTSPDDNETIQDPCNSELFAGGEHIMCEGDLTSGFLFEMSTKTHRFTSFLDVNYTDDIYRVGGRVMVSIGACTDAQ